jgi:hypothetical protein
MSTLFEIQFGHRISLLKLSVLFVLFQKYMKRCRPGFLLIPSISSVSVLFHHMTYTH